MRLEDYPKCESQCDTWCDSKKTHKTRCDYILNMNLNETLKPDETRKLSSMWVSMWNSMRLIKPHEDGYGELYVTSSSLGNVQRA